MKCATRRTKRKKVGGYNGRFTERSNKGRSGRNGGSKTGDVTSYDYDAPLTEDGQITEKYRLFKEVIAKYTDIHEIPLTTEIRRRAYGRISCTGKTDLFSVLDKISVPVKSSYPLTMEDIGQDYGYIL